MNSAFPAPYTFAEKVARREAFKASLVSEVPDADLLALRCPSRSEKCRAVRERFKAFRGMKRAARIAPGTSFVF